LLPCVHAAIRLGGDNDGRADEHGHQYGQADPEDKKNCFQMITFSFLLKDMAKRAPAALDWRSR